MSAFLLYWQRFTRTIFGKFALLFFCWKQILANSVFHQKWSRKINQIKCLIEAGPAKFTIRTASVWLLLCNQEVLILTASQTSSFQGQRQKNEFAARRGGSVNDYVYVASRWRVCRRGREAFPFLLLHAILPSLLPPDLSTLKATLKNEWKGENTFNSSLSSGCSVCCQGNCFTQKSVE